MQDVRPKYEAARETEGSRINGKDKNDKREEINGCGTATQRKCQAASPLVRVGGAAHVGPTAEMQATAPNLYCFFHRAQPAPHLRPQSAQSSLFGQYTTLIPLYSLHISMH